MRQALQPERQGSTDIRAHRPGTRPDAIVFAWLLDLPAEINSTDAARAVLDATRSTVHLLTPYQRSVVAELVKLIRKDESGWSSPLASKTGRRFRRGDRVRGLFPKESRSVKRFRGKQLVCLIGGRDPQD